MIKLNDNKNLYVKVRRTSKGNIDMYVCIDRYILTEYTNGHGAKYRYSLKKAFTYVSGDGSGLGKTPKEAFKEAYGKARRAFKRDALLKIM